MAPFKQPKSLLETTRYEIGKLVINKCLDIDSKYSFKDPSWHEEVDKLQTLMLQHIPAGVWNTICDDVLRDASLGVVALKDSRVLYATLVHRNMKELVVKPLCNLTKNCRFYSSSIEPFTEEDESHRDFWLHLIGKLSNIEVLDIRHIDCDEIYAAVGATCRQLKDLTFESKSLKCIALLQNCTKLRQLGIVDSSLQTCDKEADIERVHLKNALETFPDLACCNAVNMGDVLDTLDVSHPLNLRDYYHFGDCSPRHISNIVRLCPNLTSLTINPLLASGHNCCAEIFEILAASSLQLTNLFIFNLTMNKNVEDFLKIKGHFIESFVVLCDSEKIDLNSVVISIALYCKNLSKLDVHDYRPVSTIQNMLPIKGSLFKHLDHFGFYGEENKNLAIPEFCLSHSSKLTSLLISLPMLTDHQLMALLNVTRLREISKLELAGFITAQVLHHFYTNCPKLTDLKLCGTVDEEARNYLTNLQSHIKENNLDLKWVIYEVAS